MRLDGAPSVCYQYAIIHFFFLLLYLFIYLFIYLEIKFKSSLKAADVKWNEMESSQLKVNWRFKITWRWDPASNLETAINKRQQWKSGLNGAEKRLGQSSENHVVEENRRRRETAVCFVLLSLFDPLRSCVLLRQFYHKSTDNEVILWVGGGWGGGGRRRRRRRRKGNASIHRPPATVAVNIAAKENLEPAIVFLPLLIWSDGRREEGGGGGERRGREGEGGSCYGHPRCWAFETKISLWETAPNLSVPTLPLLPPLPPLLHFYLAIDCSSIGFYQPPIGNASPSSTSFSSSSFSSICFISLIEGLNDKLFTILILHHTVQAMTRWNNDRRLIPVLQVPLVITINSITTINFVHPHRLLVHRFQPSWHQNIVLPQSQLKISLMTGKHEQSLTHMVIGLKIERW